MLDWTLFYMPSENFSLCINVLRAQSAISWEMTYIFPMVVSAIKIFVVTLQSETQSKAYAIPHQIRTKAHFRDGTCKMVLQAIEQTFGWIRQRVQPYDLLTSLLTCCRLLKKQDKTNKNI